jgi:hypothetical protein
MKQKYLNIYKHLFLKKGSVKYNDEFVNTVITPGSRVKELGASGRKGIDIPKITVNEMIEEIKEMYPISDREAIVIKEICEEQAANREIRDRVTENPDNLEFLRKYRNDTIRPNIINSYQRRDLYEYLEKEYYVDDGGIINLMSESIVNTIIGKGA